MKNRYVYRVTVVRHGATQTWHFLTRRAADRYAEKHRRGFYVEARSMEESGYRVPPAESVVLEMSAPLLFMP